MTHPTIHPFRIEQDPNGPSVVTMLEAKDARGYAVGVDLGTVAPYYAQWLVRTRAEAESLAGQIKAGNRPAIERDLPDWLNEPRGTIYLA